MRRISFFAGLFLVFCSYAWGDAFLSSLKDVPLAPGLKEITANGSVLEGPLGPIIIAYAKGDGPADKVRDFYEGALPALGWEKAGEDTWRRNHDLLKLEFTGHGRDPVVVSFTLHGRTQ